MFKLVLAASALFGFSESLTVSKELCDEIASIRRKAARVSKDSLLFLDETALRVNAAPRTTLVYPGETAYVLTDSTSSYAARFDMIACCNSKQVFPPFIFSPTERQIQQTRGINKHMLLSYIRDLLAQAVGALDTYPLRLVLDQASIHHEAEIMQEFHDLGCHDLTEIWFMPVQGAKRVSPLDNALFHEWKERCRKHAPIKARDMQRVMSDEWNNLPAEHIREYYQHCGLMGRARA
jgi:hypothetical protein